MVCHAIAEIQEQSGRAVDSITEQSRPFVDVDGFDSLNGEEVTSLLLEELSF
jgi:acyl carrier protein